MTSASDANAESAASPQKKEDHRPRSTMRCPVCRRGTFVGSVSHDGARLPRTVARRRQDRRGVDGVGELSPGISSSWPNPCHRCACRRAPRPNKRVWTAGGGPAVPRCAGRRSARRTVDPCAAHRHAPGRVRQGLRCERRRPRCRHAHGRAATNLRELRGGDRRAEGEEGHRQLLLAPETVVALRDHLSTPNARSACASARHGPTAAISSSTKEQEVEYHPQRFTKLFAEAVGPTAATSTTPRWSRSPPHSRTAALAPVVTEGGCELIVARPAARAIAEALPEAVSAAVIDFITGSLIENPHSRRPRVPRRTRWHPYRPTR